MTDGLIYDFECRGFVPHVPERGGFANEALYCSKCSCRLWFQASTSGPSGWFSERRIHLIEEDPV